MRWLALVLALASGCGRLHFDDLSPDAAVSELLASDDFARTVANDWGTADLGGTWTIYNPMGATFDVSTGHGLVGLGAAETYTDFHVGTETALDTETRVLVSVDPLPAPGGGAYYVFVSLRWDTPGNVYNVIAAVGSDGQIDLQLNVGLSRNNTPLTPRTPVLTGIAANDRIAISVRATGASPTELCARAWREGDPEPVACAVTAEDTSPVLQVPGSSHLGVLSGTGASPTTVSFAAFRFFRIGPQ